MGIVKVMDDDPAPFGVSENFSFDGSLLVIVTSVLTGAGAESEMLTICSRFRPTVGVLLFESTIGLSPAC